MHYSKISRRHLMMMSSLGLTSAFLPSLLGRSRRAQAANDAPRRIIIMTSAHQLMPDVWRMPRGNEVGQPFSFSLGGVPDAELSPVIAKLASHKARVLAVDGLSLASGIPNEGFFQGHDLSTSNLLTAAGYDKEDGRTHQGPSVDQVIAQGIAHPDRIPSLELSTHNNTYVAAGPGERPPSESSPAKLAERLFPATISETPTRDELLEIESSSALDLSASRYQQLLPRLASEDREKLDRHRQMLRDLERRQVELRSLGCVEPDGVTENADGKLAKVRQFARQIGAAFACDATRVATVQVSQLNTEEFGAPPGDVHQDYAHAAGGSDNARAEMDKYTIAYAEIFATIVDEIAAYSDVSGNLLDNTLVVWMAEHGLTRGAHTPIEHGALVVGNAGGYFNTGRYVSLARDTPYPKEGKDPMGRPHSHLLVSFMQACGLSDKVIGLPSFEVHDGSQVSLEGPIAELMA